MGDALGACELAGADAEDAAEGAQEGEAANTGYARQVCEAGAFGGVAGEVIRGAGDEAGLGVGARRGEVRPAALAGAKAGLFGGGGGGEEADVLARGAAAGTAWAAVDHGGFDGIKELAVGGCVARKYLLPLAAGKEAGRGGGGWIPVAGVVLRRNAGVPWLGHGERSPLPVSSLEAGRATLRNVQRSCGLPAPFKFCAVCPLIL